MKHALLSGVTEMMMESRTVEKRNKTKKTIYAPAYTVIIIPGLYWEAVSLER